MPKTVFFYCDLVTEDWGSSIKNLGVLGVRGKVGFGPHSCPRGLEYFALVALIDTIFLFR